MTEHYTHLLQEVLNAAKELAIQKHNYQVDSFDPAPGFCLGILYRFGP